ncbi:hypothetical protein HYV43_05700 [Candidatus Micrarchaeota archaeon]|nr:hypothetical protein [Candidatus Micrarchaeota archaeon]
MSSLNIAVVGGSPDSRKAAASALAKKSHNEDVSFYHTVFSGKKVNVLEPSSYPEKPVSLAIALSGADFIVLLAEPSPQMGETLVLLSALGKSHGVLVGVHDVSAFMNEVGLHYDVFSTLDEAKTKILSFEAQRPKDAPPKAWLDHAFDVRGVGSVALGFMVQGTMHVHDKLPAKPGDVALEVRSIQQNDVDVEHAEAGDRFGIKYKGPAPDQLGRGTVLGDVPVFAEVEATVNVPKYWKELPGKQLHAVAGFQSVPCQVDKDLVPGTAVDCLIQFHKPVALRKDAVVLFDLNAKGLRVAGVAQDVG